MGRASRTPHDQGHHGANRSSHPCPVVAEVIEGLVGATLCVPLKALEQCERNGLGQAVGGHDLGKAFILGDGHWAAAIDCIEPAMELGHDLRRGTGFIDRIVGDPTKSVEVDGRLLKARRQQT